LLPALRRALRDGDDGRTLDGRLRTALTVSDMRGVVRGPQVPERFGAGLLARMWVDVENTGARAWPGMSVWPRDTVGLQVRWRDERTGALVYQSPVLLAQDLETGETMRAQIESHVPPPGTYLLEIGLVQLGPWPAARWFSDVVAGEGVLRRRVEAVVFGL
jgi:hypothetical protein